MEKKRRSKDKLPKDRMSHRGSHPNTTMNNKKQKERQEKIAREQEKRRLIEKIRDLYPGYDDEYKLLEEIGDGGYGKVYRATCVLPETKGRFFAVKKITKDNEYAVAREVNVLRQMNHPNIIKLLDVRKSERERHLSLLVFELVPSLKYTSLYPFLQPRDVKRYGKMLLSAVDYLHDHKWVHCDIKPRNILIDHRIKFLYLIDLGQARKVEAGKTYSPHVGTLAFRAPEILFNYSGNSYPIDAWSVGMTLLYMMAPTVRTYFHIDGPTDSNKDRADMIRKLAKIFGSKALIDVAKQCSYKHEVKLPDYPSQSLSQWLRYYLSKEFDFENKLTKDALDLLTQLLNVDFTKRITIKKALKHHYFS